MVPTKRDKMKSQLKHSEYSLNPHEVRHIINSAESFRDRLIIKCLYYGGMRVGEVERLEVQDIDFMRNVIHIRHSKNDKTRSIPFIDSDFKSDIRHFIGPKTKDRIFKISKRQMQNVVRNVGNTANLKHPNPGNKYINCHLFRHSIARHLKGAKYQLEWIQKFLGHTKLETTADQYGTISLNEMQLELVQKGGDRSLLPYKEAER